MSGPPNSPICLLESTSPQRLEGLVCRREAAPATCLPQSPNFPKEFGATEADTIHQRPWGTSLLELRSALPEEEARRPGALWPGVPPPRGLSGGRHPCATVTHLTASSCFPSPAPPGDRRLRAHKILPPPSLPGRLIGLCMSQASQSEALEPELFWTHTVTCHHRVSFARPYPPFPPRLVCNITSTGLL